MVLSGGLRIGLRKPTHAKTASVGQQGIAAQEDTSTRDITAGWTQRQIAHRDGVTVTLVRSSIKSAVLTARASQQCGLM